MTSIHFDELLVSRHGQSEVVSCVAVSPDGRWVAAGGGEPQFGSVRVWDTTSHRVAWQGRTHASVVTRVKWLPDSGCLATAGDDGTIRVLEWPGGATQRQIEVKKLRQSPLRRCSHRTTIGVLLRGHHQDYRLDHRARSVGVDRE